MRRASSGKRSPTSSVELSTWRTARSHYGEVEERGIRGRASREDADALREEGIEVMALPLPAAVKGPVQ